MNEHIPDEANQINVQTLFTWAVLFVAFLTAMVGLLPIFEKHMNLLLEGSLIATYELVTLGLAYCFRRALVVLGFLHIWRKQYVHTHPHIPKEFASPAAYEAILFGKHARLFRALAFVVVLALPNLILIGIITS